jgi:hypothetical protein
MLILIIGFSMIRSLKVLAPFSLAANVISIGGKEFERITEVDLSNILGLCIIMQYVVRSHLPLNEFPLITKASDWPIFFASAMYVFEGIALVCHKKMISEGEKKNIDFFSFYQFDRK